MKGSPIHYMNSPDVGECLAHFGTKLSRRFYRAVAAFAFIGMKNQHNLLDNCLVSLVQNITDFQWRQAKVDLGKGTASICRHVVADGVAIFLLLEFGLYTTVLVPRSYSFTNHKFSSSPQIVRRHPHWSKFDWEYGLLHLVTLLFVFAPRINPPHLPLYFDSTIQ